MSLFLKDSAEKCLRLDWTGSSDKWHDILAHMAQFMGMQVEAAKCKGHTLVKSYTDCYLTDGSGTSIGPLFSMYEESGFNSSVARQIKQIEYDQCTAGNSSSEVGKWVAVGMGSLVGLVFLMTCIHYCYKKQRQAQQASGGEYAPAPGGSDNA